MYIFQLLSLLFSFLVIYRKMNGTFIFIQIAKDTPVSKPWRPDPMPHFAAFDLVLHCLLMSPKKDTRFISA